MVRSFGGKRKEDGRRGEALTCPFPCRACRSCVSRLLELVVRIDGVNEKGLEVPDAPAEGHKPLALLEVAGDRGAGRVPMTTRTERKKVETRRIMEKKKESENIPPMS